MWSLPHPPSWALSAEPPDSPKVPTAATQTRLFSEAASALGMAIPASPMRSSTLIDGKVWDGSDPAGYARSFAIKV